MWSHLQKYVQPELLSQITAPSGGANASSMTTAAQCLLITDKGKLSKLFIEIIYTKISLNKINLEVLSGMFYSKVNLNGPKCIPFKAGTVQYLGS